MPNLGNSDEEFPGSYKAFCRHCPATFTNRLSIRKHLTEDHNRLPNYRIVLCDMCCFVGDDIGRAMRDHKDCHYLSVVYKCNRCLYLSSTHNGILSHVGRAFCTMDDLALVMGPGVSIPLSSPVHKMILQGKLNKIGDTN